MVIYQTNICEFVRRLIKILSDFLGKRGFNNKVKLAPPRKADKEGHTDDVLEDVHF